LQNQYRKEELERRKEKVEIQSVKKRNIKKKKKKE